MDSLVSLVAVSIPLAPFALGGFVIWTRHKQKLATGLHDRTESLAQYQSYNRDLEERVRVLERIVTDRGYDLAAQIEALRDGDDGAPVSGLKRSVGTL